ncbi:DUF6934 family protein [Dyadobacter sandarakinus]|uniref:Uncharacterized protein n=1 Tax=Dyadobacter sandarakinus TaxID=2747268 RepID=A0ABX7IAZ1_9BACT|nr:hypothetical protein [Dyadobacter sandarakinus]QRR02106.1 hypothetical protein HWI92_14925 [Dyadobacter sandarakinus]
MKDAHYPFITNAGKTRFCFESVGKGKTVQKLVVYTLLTKDPPLYNLALGDSEDGNDFDDEVITNNGDMPKVIATVIRTLLKMLAKHQNASVYLAGNSRAKTRLYRIIINRKLAELKKYYEIYGVEDLEPEIYIPGKEYRAFIIKKLINVHDGNNKRQEC